MKKPVLLLSSLFAICAPCVAAQTAGQDNFKLGIAPGFTPQKITTQVGATRGAVSLDLARPDAPVSTMSAADPAFSAWGQKERPWHLSDRQEDYSIGSSFVIGDNQDIDNRLLISPRFTESRSSDSGLESFSAEIRLGNMVQFDRSSANKGWYVFAAADGEALSINTGSLAIGDENPMAVSLSDQITVGDLQAGVSTFVGSTQLTISYIQTEAEYSAPGSERISKKESFAGFSLARNF